MAQGEEEIEEVGNLGADQEDGGDGDVSLEGEGGLEEGRGGAGCASQLSVVAGFGGQAGEVHGEEGGVGAKQGSPEVELAEGFGEGAVEEQGGPVVRRAEETEDAGHGHDEVKVGDDEEGVVEVLVEDGLGEDGAGESARYE